MSDHPAVRIRTGAIVLFPLLMAIVAVSAASLSSSPGDAGQASSIPTADLIQPDQLASIVQRSGPEKPLIIQVGSRVLFEEAHIPGSEYIGPASTPEGREQLRQRLQSVSRQRFVVLYCGCCPWTHCPNIKPAWDVLQSLGFSKAKILYVANNFGADWVDKGYPITKGH